MNQRLPVTAIVMTKNESSNVEKCLLSLSGIDQIFVVDSGSTDGTQKIAEDLGAEVVDFAWNGLYPKKKQWCLENLDLRHDWVFYVDADEEATPALLVEIGKAIAESEAASGYFVGYDYAFAGKTLKYGHKVFKLVLFNRLKGGFKPYDDLDASNMWEVEGHYQPTIDGPVRTLSNPMLHTDHDTLFHYFDRHNRYSDWEAIVRSKNAYLSESDTQTSGRRRLKSLFDKVPFKGPVAFLYSYVLKMGFLDGKAGLDFALSRGFYYWQIEMKSAELRRLSAERMRSSELLERTKSSER